MSINFCYLLLLHSPPLFQFPHQVSFQSFCPKWSFMPSLPPFISSVQMPFLFVCLFPLSVLSLTLNQNNWNITPPRSYYSSNDGLRAAFRTRLLTGIFEWVDLLPWLRAGPFCIYCADIQVLNVNRPAMQLLCLWEQQGMPHQIPLISLLISFIWMPLQLHPGIFFILDPIRINLSEPAYPEIGCCCFFSCPCFCLIILCSLWYSFCLVLISCGFGVDLWTRDLASWQFGIIHMIQLQRSYCNTLASSKDLQMLHLLYGFLFTSNFNRVVKACKAVWQQVFCAWFKGVLFCSQFRMTQISLNLEHRLLICGHLSTSEDVEFDLLWLKANLGIVKKESY